MVACNQPVVVSPKALAHFQRFAEQLLRLAGLPWFMDGDAHHLQGHGQLRISVPPTVCVGWPRGWSSALEWGRSFPCSAKQFVHALKVGGHFRIRVVRLEQFFEERKGLP
jgi:hypothetical protein